MALDDPFRHPLLQAMSPDARNLFANEITSAALGARAILFEPERPLDRVWFVESGLISLSTVLGDGKVAEGLTVGRGAALGLPASLGGRRAFGRATVQVAGRAWTMTGEACRRAMAADPGFSDRLMRYYEATFAAVAGISACNAAHSLRQRFCRWLLAARDQLDADQIPLGQQFLTQLLGVNRTTLAPISKELRRQGVISVGYGRIDVLNPALLSEFACGCHAIAAERFARVCEPAADEPPARIT